MKVDPQISQIDADLESFAMGQSFIVTNHTAKEYFDPLTLGEANKLHGIIAGSFTTLALSLLALRSKADKLKGTRAGTWSGSDLELVGEYDFELYDHVRREYKDMSYAVIAMLCEAKAEAREYFISEFARDPLGALAVGNTIFLERSEVLRQALHARFGDEWTKRFKQAAAEWPSRAKHPGS